MTRFDLRRMAGRTVLAAFVAAPAGLYAQHPTPPPHPTPAQQVKPAAPAPAKTTPEPAQATKAGSFGDLQAAVERIQKRISTKVGATSVPQTALVSVPKPPRPADSHAKTPAPPPAKADDKKAAPAPAPAPAASGAASAMPKEPRIRLSWRSTLTWPAEIAPPPLPGPGRINLTWK